MKWIACMAVSGFLAVSCQSAVLFKVRSQAQEDLGCEEVEIHDVTARVAGERPNLEYEQRFMLVKGCKRQKVYECRGREGEAYPSVPKGHASSPRGVTTGPWKCWSIGDTLPDERSVGEERIPRP
jgi:hypothetical protein